MFKHYLLVLLLAIGCRPAFATKYYVAPTGNDANSGTITAPFLTIQRAQTAVVAGDTVWIRGGTYLMSNANIAGHSTAAAGSYAYLTYLTKSGTATARINYWAYPGERPVFNYVNVDPSVTNTNASTNPGAVPAPYRISAFEVTGAYLHLRGLEVVRVPVAHVGTGTNTLSICFSQSGAGGNNIYERLSMHDGQAIGFYLTRGGNNLILNCDAYHNNDDVNVGNTTGTANGGNVDGFGNHPNQPTYTGNVFRGCRAWQNSDDGYDCISAFAATTFENCWAFYNGYTSNFVSRGDGNGFKAGGYGTATSFPTVIPNNTVQFCVSVRNKSNGFYSNHHQAGSYWYDNTAYQNGINYNMVNRKDRTTTGYLVDVPGYGHVLRNNVSLRGRSVANPDTISLSNSASTYDHNTFGKGPIPVTTSDFVSLDTTLLRSPRQADGSLPVVPLLRLAPGSGLLDAGVNVGFPYSAAAPDLGAYEFASPTIWTGAVSTDWLNGANWTAGVPTSTVDALLPVVSTGRYPAISTGSATAQSLSINVGATLTQSGGTLSLTGMLTNNGTYVPTGGTLATSGSTSQLLGGINPLALQDLTIGGAGASLGTPASFRRVLTLTGNLTTDFRPLTLLSSVSGGVATDALVVNSGGTVRGMTTVQRAIDPSLNPGLGYRHYSSPVSTATVADLATSGFTPVVNPAYNTSASPATVTPFPTVYGYDQGRLATTSNNLPVFDKGFGSPAALSEPLVVGQGYTVNIDASQVVDFVGALNNGDVILTLARNTGATAADAGWALLGNPYPAPLDYSLVAAADRSNLEGAIYVYSSTSHYVGQYRAYINNVGGNPILPVGQGFFARVSAGQSSGSLTFRNSQRLAAPNTTTFQRTTADLRPQVQLELRGRTGPADTFYAYAEIGATTAFDSQFDAAKLPNPNGLNLAGTTTSGEAVAIDGCPAFLPTTVLPLTVGVPAAGTYALSAAALRNLPTSLEAYLADDQTGQTLKLSAGTSYSFGVTAAQAASAITGRFRLYFRPATALATVPSLTAEVVGVYPNPARERFTVSVPGLAQATTVQAELLNSLGQAVRRQLVALPLTGTQFTLETATLATGVYTLRLQTGATTLAKRVAIQ